MGDAPESVPVPVEQEDGEEANAEAHPVEPLREPDESVFYRERQDVAELALEAKLFGGNDPDFGKAVELVLWSVYNKKQEFRQLSKPKPALPWRGACCGCCVAICVILLTVLLLLITKASSNSVTAQEGVLLATGVNELSGHEPIASAAAAVERMPLASCSALPAEKLKEVRSVVFVHQGIWRCMHVARVLKFGTSQTWFEAADGSAVRVDHGRAFLRLGALLDEETITMSGEAGVSPMVVFDVIGRTT